MWYYAPTPAEAERMSEAPAEIAARVARVRERIAQAAAHAGRRPEEVRLVAVSKLVSAERIREAIAAGVADLGENYLQEAAEKQAQVVEPVRWHLIGHLQSNKAARAAAIFDIVHTVDSPRIARALGRYAAEYGRELEALLQVNTSGEETKSGVAPTEAERLLAEVAGVAGLRVRGLMTIGRWDPDPERARPEFRLLAQLARDLERRSGVELRWLSMGMSRDFEVAIEEGATLVRVGTGVFGPRPE
jgi:pyridoxal phosphate enzyme (YggS family)